jgi:hypothetical protein
MLDPEPSAPSWPTTYEPPTARQVVSAGLQLAVTASKPIRRASIYIGMLALGAFGPAIVVFIIGLSRLLADPATADILMTDPTVLLDARPDLVTPLRMLGVLLVVGSLLLVAISVDAQAIAISQLAGVASGRPLTLGDAVTRARQTFWRLLGASILVGLASGLVALAVTLPFGGTGTNSGINFFASLIGALAVTPWAYAGTGIVLGDVGAIEALRRSVALFRVRQRVALVVVLFTLVTAAIQTFALDAGVGLAAQAGEVLGIGLEEGPASLVLPAILILAFVVALGSLIFTIAAIVAAPQVVAFLGLTFHSGGLDRARPREALRYGPFHWVSVPFAIAIALMALVALSALSMVGSG